MRLSKPIWVVKVGGRLCDDVVIRAALAQACTDTSVHVVLVHGGGCVVSTMQAALGQEAHFVEGRRVTDAAQMQVVEMTLSGHLNKAMVRALISAGCVALGISGLDADMVRCTLVPGLGAVGLPKAVNVQPLRALLASGFTPVLSPVSAGPDGAPVNVNADEFACAIAAGLAAEKLLLLSDVTAVKVAGQGQDVIADDAIEALIARGEITGGMVPKLRSAARAVAAGVGEVRIGGFGATFAQVRGTSVVPRWIGNGDER